MWMGSILRIRRRTRRLRYSRVTFDQVLEQQLGVMDLTAMVLCRENNMPVVVFDVSEDGALVAISQGADIGTSS